MSYEQVQKVEITNYGCIRQQSFALTPLLTDLSEARPQS